MKQRKKERKKIKKVILYYFSDGKSSNGRSRYERRRSQLWRSDVHW